MRPFVFLQVYGMPSYSLVTVTVQTRDEGNGPFVLLPSLCSPQREVCLLLPRNVEHSLAESVRLPIVSNTVECKRP